MGTILSNLAAYANRYGWMGSFMRLLWDPTRNLDPKAIEDLVMLEQAGLSLLSAPPHPTKRGPTELDPIRSDPRSSLAQPSPARTSRRSALRWL